MSSFAVPMALPMALSLLLWLPMSSGMLLPQGSQSARLGSRGPRRQFLGSSVAAALSTWSASPASADDPSVGPLRSGGWEATRQAKLKVMSEKTAAHDKLCVGRMPNDKPLNRFDMTFDPPCYISGYYELIAIGVILSGLKVGQTMEEKKEAARMATEHIDEVEAQTTTAGGGRSNRSGQDSLRMQLRWPGANGGDEDFFPKGGPEAFDRDEGSLRRQILANANPIQGSLGGYSVLRPAMKRAFAAVSVDGTDNGWITSSDQFTKLMRSVGEELPDEDYERLFGLCRGRKASFTGQQPGTVTFEQWVAVMLQTVDEAKDPDAKPFFGLF